MKTPKILGVILLFSATAVLAITGYVLTRPKIVQPSPTPEAMPVVKDETVFSCGDSIVKDIDGNEYKTVKIGEQCWLKENLKVTKNPQGEPITRYCYDNDPKICETDGGLYDWNTAMNNSTQEGVQGICPDGWHVPKDSEWSEWNVLEKGSEDRVWDCEPSGTKLASGDSSGFQGVLAGYRYTGGSFIYRGGCAFFWSSAGSGTKAWSQGLSSSGATYRATADKSVGFSVRCLKD